MKIIFNRQQVLSAVTPLLCATSGKSTLTAAEGFLIVAKYPDVCEFTAYDLEKGMQTTVEAKVLEEGSYVINAQKLLQTMRVMNGEEVMLAVEENLTAVFTCGKSSHKTIALSGADFPELPNLASDRGFTLPQKTFREMIGKTMYAMGVNDQRPVLNGCFFEVEANKLLVVACDSFKLAKCCLNTEIKGHNADGSEIRFRFIIPSKTIGELYRLLSDDEKEVRIQMMRRHIIFYIDDLIFFSRLVDGEYIDYDRIIIRQHKIYLTMPREELLSALERASLITEERVAGSVRSHVKLQADGGVLKIMAASAAGSTYDEIEVTQEGPDILIAFNNRFLMDSVAACRCDTIRLALSSPLTSVNIEAMEGGDENSEDLFMLLPVRMKE